MSHVALEFFPCHLSGQDLISGEDVRSEKTNVSFLLNLMFSNGNKIVFVCPSSA